MEEMTEALVEAFLINNRVNLKMVDALTDEALAATLSTRGGRTVGMQLAHMLDVRRWQMEAADKELAADMPKVTREEAGDAALLHAGFEQSGALIAELIRRSMKNGGKVRGFKRGIVAMVTYFTAHEAHHRGGALLTIKQCKIKRSEDLKMGLWGWNKI